MSVLCEPITVGWASSARILMARSHVTWNNAASQASLRTHTATALVRQGRASFRVTQSVPPSGQMHEEYQISKDTFMKFFLQESCFFVSFSFNFYDFHAVSCFILDIDECSSVSEPCTNGFNCINTVGSYNCQRKIIMCSRGYHSSADGARCIGEDAHKYTQLYLIPLLELNPFRHRFIF